MPELLTELEQGVLMKSVNEAIELQTARVELEKRALDNLLLLRADIRACRLPEKIEKVRNGMVTLEMLNLVKKRG